MIHLKTAEEIELMRESSLLVSLTLAHVAALIKPGATTMQLDKAAEEFITANNAVPSFKGYKGYPYTACISVNDAVVHGFPTDIPLKEGDVISVDLGAFKNGFHGDSAYTFAINDIADEVKKLLKDTKASLYKGIEQARINNRIGDISFAVQDYTERLNGYGVVRDLVGHGLGRKLHEDPQVPNFGKRGSGSKIKEGLVIAIEPMINMGTKEVYYDEDGWTIKTKDGKPSAHYEHNVAVRKSGVDILSTFENIEAAEKANPFLFSDY